MLGEADPLGWPRLGGGRLADSHLVAELFAKEAGIKIQHVPYKGGSQGLADLIGGQITFASQTLPSTVSYTTGGSLTAVVQSSKARLLEFPELPTFKDEGYDIVSTTWYSLSGPPKVPDEIVQKVNRAIAAGMAMPKIQSDCTSMDFIRSRWVLMSLGRSWGTKSSDGSPKSKHSG